MPLTRLDYVSLVWINITKSSAGSIRTGDIFSHDASVIRFGGFYQHDEWEENKQCHCFLFLSSCEKEKSYPECILFLIWRRRIVQMTLFLHVPRESITSHEASLWHSTVVRSFVLMSEDGRYTQSLLLFAVEEINRFENASLGDGSDEQGLRFIIIITCLLSCREETFFSHIVKNRTEERLD